MREQQYGIVPSLDRKMLLQDGMGRRNMRQAVSLLHLRQGLRESLQLQEQRAVLARRRYLHLRGRLSRKGLRRAVPRRYLRGGLRAEMRLQERGYLLARERTLQLHSW